MDQEARPPLPDDAVKHAIRTLADIAGFPCVFLSRPTGGPLDIVYGRDPAEWDCALFVAMAPSGRGAPFPPTDVCLDGDAVFFFFDGQDPSPPVARSSGGTVVASDIVLATHALITGQHETGMRKDRHGHPHVETSFLYRRNLLHIPIVNQYAALIRDAFPSLAPLPPWPDGKAYAVALTHDVDYPEMIRWIEALRYIAGGNFKLSELAGIVSGRNHFWKFQDWIDLENRHGVRSAFYFCGKKGSLSRYFLVAPDPFYDVASPKFREAISKLKKLGFEVGNHASYYAFRSAAAFIAEMETVEKSLGDKILGNRHHYWSLNHDYPAETAEIHDQAGLLYDTSICYERRAGFRYGIASPFRFYNSKSATPAGTLEMPTAVMDNHLFGYRRLSRFETPEREIGELLAQTRKVGGLFIADYHLRGLNETFFPGWGKTYQYLLEAITSDPLCHCATPAAIARHWIDRENKLRQASAHECDGAHQ